jgi:quinol monooxygenase YgiN
MAQALLYLKCHYYVVCIPPIDSSLHGGNMSTVNIFLRVYSDKRDEFLQTIRSLQTSLQEEVGLKKSTLFQDTSDPNVFHLIEDWTTHDSMDRYIRSERFSVLMGALKVLCAESEVRYQITSDNKQSVKVNEV